MKTKSVLFACLAALAAGLFVPILSAEPPEGAGKKGPPNVAERLEHMKENLGLTDAQVAQLKDIFAKHMEAIKALRDDTSLTREAKREKMKELREAQRKEVDAVLTAEQRAKMREAMQHRKGPGGPDDGDRKGPPPSEGEE